MSYITMFCDVERCVRYARYESLDTDKRYCVKHMKELWKTAKKVLFAEELLAELNKR